MILQIPAATVASDCSGCCSDVLQPAKIDFTLTEPSLCTSALCEATSSGCMGLSDKVMLFQTVRVEASHPGLSTHDQQQNCSLPL